MQRYDAIVLAGFGGPEKPGDVEPFIARVLEGRDVPAARAAKVVEQYKRVHPEGISPYNQRTREQAAALANALGRRGIGVPVRLAYRNMPPFFDDVVRELSQGDFRRVLVIVLAVQRGSASIGRYIEEFDQAIARAGDHRLIVDYADPFFDHPLFIAAHVEAVRAALRRLNRDRFDDTAIIFTAHSIPEAIANQGPYARDVERTAWLIATTLAARNWGIAYQSRSGRPSVPWLEPDIKEAIRALPEQNIDNCIVVPIGFLCDHVEVLYDIDVDAASVAREVGIEMERAATLNSHPLFIETLADVVASKCA